MDPVSAIGTASAIVGLVDFATKIIGSTYEVIQSRKGAKEDHIHLAGVCGHLDYVTQKIRSRAAKANARYMKEDESHLLELAVRSEALSSELLDVLRPLKVDPNRRFQTWEAFRVAIGGLMSAGRLSELRARLDDLRGQITLQVVFMMSNSQSAMARSISAITSRCETMHAEQIDLITQSHNALLSAIQNQGGDFQATLYKLQQTNVEEIMRKRRQGQMQDSSTLNLSQRDVLMGSSAEPFVERKDKPVVDYTPKGPTEIDEGFSLQSLLSSKTEKEGRLAKLEAENNAARVAGAIEADRAIRNELQSKRRFFGKLEDIEKVADPQDADAFRATLAKMMREVSAALKGADATHAAVSILESLKFREMPMRHLDIPSTYGRTFNWIFDNDRTPFRSWLTSANGVFWVSGKAGSGKSTLMKYLADHPETRRLLQTGSPTSRLFIGSFYFWHSGYPMQKSQQGLLQSLLYQVLKSHPGAIEKSCSKRWSVDDRSDPPPWTREEVLSSLQEALACLVPSTRFCFFIDGLDELASEGSNAVDHYELVSLLDKWTQYPQVKICASSRPWNVFRKAYSAETTRLIQLEDLTHRDMEIYVSGRLENDPRFRRLAAADPEAYTLADEIHSRADGVFLWVFLVVRSLLLGLSDDDDIPELRRRLRALPKDLRSWFGHMLEIIDETYQEYTARSLLIACAAETPLPTLAFWHIELEKDDPHFALHAMVKAEAADSYDARLYKVRTTINKWCRDLLEVRKNPGADESQVLDGHKVDFLHRSVREFLTEDHIYNTLQQRAGLSFNPRLTLCRSFCAQSKALNVDQESVIDLPSYKEWSRNVMIYANACEKTDNFSPAEELDELNRVGNMWSDRVGNRKRHWTGEQSFLKFAQQYDLLQYIKHASESHENRHPGGLHPGWYHASSGTASHPYGLNDGDLHRERSTERKRDRFKSMFSRSPRSSQADLTGFSIEQNP